MVRNRPRKTKIGTTNEMLMMEAVKRVLDGGWSIKRAYIELNIPRTTLTRYVQKCKNQVIDWNNASLFEIPRMCPNYNVRQVFSEQEETILSDYLKQCARLHHGLPPTVARNLAFQYGKANHKKMPVNWEIHESAGKDWFTSL